jgi:methyl-accepting chemotaxis protein
MSKSEPAVQTTVSRNPVVGWCADRSVATKSLIAAVFVGTVAIIVGALAIVQMAALRDDVRALKTNHVDSLQHVSELRGGIAAMYRGMLVFSFAAQDRALAQKGRTDITAADAQVDAALAAYTKITAGSPGRAASIDTFQKAMLNYRALRQSTLFGEPMPAGFTAPPPEQITAEFERVEASMNAAVATLQAAEDSEADAEAVKSPTSTRSPA